MLIINSQWKTIISEIHNHYLLACHFFFFFSFLFSSWMERMGEKRTQAPLSFHFFTKPKFTFKWNSSSGWLRNWWRNLASVIFKMCELTTLPPTHPTLQNPTIINLCRNDVLAIRRRARIKLKLCFISSLHSISVITISAVYRFVDWKKKNSKKIMNWSGDTF